MQSMFRTPLYPSLAPPPPSPYAPYYGALGLMPAMHERLDLLEKNCNYAHCILSLNIFNNYILISDFNRYLLYLPELN